MRGQARNLFVTEPDVSLLGDIEPGQRAQEGGLSAAAGAQEEEKLARLNRQIQAVKRRHRPEAFGQVLNSDGNHAAQRLVF